MKPRDRKPNYSGCGPFGCPPKPTIPDWGKLQSPKKSPKKELKKGCKEGKKGEKCRQWVKRGCTMGKKGRKCRKAWYKANPAPPPPPKKRPWLVSDTIQGKCKEDFRTYVKDHSGFDMVKQGVFMNKRNGLLYGACHRKSKSKRQNADCETLKKNIMRWIRRQESFAKSGMPACAKSALAPDGEDTLTKAKAAPKKKKFQNKMLKHRRKKKANKW